MDVEVIAAGAAALWYFLRKRKKAEVDEAEPVDVPSLPVPVTQSVTAPVRAEPARFISSPLPAAVEQKLAIKAEKTAEPPAPTLKPAPEVLAPPPIAQRTQGFQRKSFQPRGNLYDAGGRTWPPALPTFLK